MSKAMRGTVAAVTLVLAIVSAVGLAAMGVIGEDHLAVVAASVTARSLP